MKVKTFTLLAGAAGMLAVTGLANAGITGLYVESVASNTLTNTTLVGTTYKIYAQFDNPADRFVNALDGDIDIYGSMYNDGTFGTNLGPHISALDGSFVNLAADSYVGINAAGAGAGVTGDPSFDAAGMAGGTHIGGGWFGDAGNANNAPDANGRVLLMFLTFEGAGLPDVNGMIGTTDGNNVINTNALASLMQGSIRISYNPNGAAAGGITPLTVNFNDVPAPGALALLGVAGLVGKRRRRA